MFTRLDELPHAAAQIHGMRIAVALPYGDETIEAIRLAHQRLSVQTLLTGDPDVLRKKFGGSFPDGCTIVSAADSVAAARTAVSLVHDGRADLLMKGSVDTATLLKAVLDETNGLRTGRLLSDVFLTEMSGTDGVRLIMITDGGVNVAPDLRAKADIIRNAVDVAHVLGMELPRVAVLSAVEVVNPSMPSTLDAAALAKMNDRNQIGGCLVDGPLALDNAISPEAAAEKKIVSQVAGHADILVAPTIEAANMLAKGTTYFAAMRPAHVIAGARAPILIPSRADSADAKLLSVALGIIAAHGMRQVSSR